MGEVLVVEDDRVVLEVVARLCRSEGLRVDEIARVDGALENLARTTYRLVLVDLMLPGGSGFDLLAALTADHPRTPVIIISGYATAENAVKSLRQGAFDFLPKPFDVEELLGVVRRGLRYRQRHGEAADERSRSGERRYFLGRHSWAATDSEGMATLGAAETFYGVVGEATKIELPTAGAHTVQGQTLARLRSHEEVHRIWSPLSGLLVAVNAELEGAADRIARSPLDAGWLARIVPTDLDNELMTLTLRPAWTDTAIGG